MKLSFTWNDSDGEARVSRIDLQRLRDGYDGMQIKELDFLQDCIGILTEEYNRARSTFLHRDRFDVTISISNG